MLHKTDEITLCNTQKITETKIPNLSWFGVLNMKMILKIGNGLWCASYRTNLIRTNYHSLDQWSTRHWGVVWLLSLAILRIIIFVDPKSCKNPFTCLAVVLPVLRVHYFFLSTFVPDRKEMPSECVNNVDNFCYICREITFASRKRALTSVIKYAYAFCTSACKVDQDTSWTLYLWYISFSS